MQANIDHELTKLGFIIGVFDGVGLVDDIDKMTGFGDPPEHLVEANLDIPVFTEVGIFQLPRIGVAAQNMHWEASGAYTGEVSAEMLAEVGCDYVIIGHSERRQYFGETNETANKKLHAAVAGGLLPIYCIGETLDEREGGVMEDVVGTQVREGLAGLTEEQVAGAVLAYEPVWAIGTGRTATPDQVQDMHGHIRSLLQDIFNEAIGSGIDILYGGSVKPGNAAELFQRPNVDGGLIGGAALNAEDFAAIVRCAEEAA